jgi:hypothetical protein
MVYDCEELIVVGSRRSTVVEVGHQTVVAAVANFLLRVS